MQSLEVGIVSDEISLDFVEAVKQAKQWGISLFELRCLRSGRIPNVDQSEIRAVQETVERESIRITALSPGIFRRPLSHKVEIEHEISFILPDTIALANKLGTSLMIVFGFAREKNESSEGFQNAVEYMRRAARIAEQSGVRIAIENEPGFWCDTGSATSSMIRTIGLATIGANWDPANAIGTDERPFPEGYEAIRDVVLNVHVKDTKENALVKCVPVGEGVVDWRGQLRALEKDKRVSHVTIETHCLPLIECSKKNIDTVRHYLEESERDH
jgi:sugar phosphate isomerase/epimerase